MTSVFFSHPDKIIIVAQIIATNVERNPFFMRLTIHKISDCWRERALLAFHPFSLAAQRPAVRCIWLGQLLVKPIRITNSIGYRLWYVEQPNLLERDHGVTCGLLIRLADLQKSLTGLVAFMHG